MDKTEVYNAQQWAKWKFNREYERPEIREFAEKHKYNAYQAVSRLVTIDNELLSVKGDKEKIRAYCFRHNTNPHLAAELVSNETESSTTRQLPEYAQQLIKT